jgi:hypothetical protein
MLAPHRAAVAMIADRTVFAAALQGIAFPLVYLIHIAAAGRTFYLALIAAVNQLTELVSAIFALKTNNRHSNQTSMSLYINSLYFE